MNPNITLRLPTVLRGPVALAALALLLVAVPASFAAEPPTLPAPGLDDAVTAAPQPLTNTTAASVISGEWVAQGPAPGTFGQVENIEPDGEVTGAVHTVIAHPTAPNILWIGAVNGGIWKTTNAVSQNVKWKRQTDDQLSQSIGAMDLDPFDPASRTLLAGIGLYSSFGQIGGLRTGLLRTTNGGDTWTPVNGGGILFNKNISGVASRGDTLVASVNFASPFTFGNIGIWRSTDGGASFNQISVGTGAATGLPGGVTYDLVGDPNDPSRLYTSVVFANFIGGANGVYRSDDTGATWTKISNPAIDALLISGVTSNVEFAVGEENNVYVAIANSGRLAGVFRSGDGGATWSSLGVPLTDEGAPVGIHPGGQAFLHMSILADPTDPNIVYVGGDRQPFFNEPVPGAPGSFPNSIGANNFTGRLFRGDASQAGDIWTPLTHVGTASNSSPHADSREMVFDAAGNIIETDDGGVYKRTLPRSDQGDWFSINGDLAATEQHDGSYDGLSNILFSGNQDVANLIQDVPDGLTWTTLISGDGGDTAVDDTTLAGTSIRYTSAQGLQVFNRTFWDAGNNFLGFDFPALTVVQGSTALAGQFVTPVELNGADQSRLIIGFANGVYESLDRGDTIAEVGPGIRANGNGTDAIAYGGAGNAEILYVGSGDTLFVRTGPYPGLLGVAAGFPGNGSGFTIRDIVIDPDDADSAFVINSQAVYRTTDAGATWTTITGDLFTNSVVTPLRSITYVNSAEGDAVVIGATRGIFAADDGSGFSDWSQLGTGLPSVPVFDLEYLPGLDALGAATLGRGSFKLENAATVLSGQSLGTNRPEASEGDR